MEVPPQATNRLRVRANVADGESHGSGGVGAPLRREVQSGMPGLTFDQAGRPVYVSFSWYFVLC